MKKHYVLEFEDQSASATEKLHDGLALSLNADEALGLTEIDGIPFISGNGPGLVKLGELLVRLGLSDYKSGFHLHLKENFDEKLKEVLIIGIVNQATN